MTTAFGYVRVSDPNSPDAASLDTQEAALREWCAERGISLARVFRESHTGIELHERPELQALLAALAGGADLVLFYALDRFSRDPVHQMWLRVTVAAAGARLECVTEPLPEGDAGVLLQFVGGWAAKREWTQIRERTVRGKRARVEAGKLPGSGIDLYGYVKHRELGRRTIVEREAAVVRDIFDWIAAGHSLREVCRRLEEAGVPPPSAGKTKAGERARWQPGIIRRIIRNPEYAGRAYAWRHRWDAERRRMVERPEVEWIALPEGTTPAIVDGATWQRANDRLAANVGDHARAMRDHREYLLRGVLSCGRCGRRLYSDLQHGHRVYRCAGTRARHDRCRLPYVRADRIEPAVWERVRRFILDPELISHEEQARRSQSGAGLAASIAAVEGRIARIVAGQEKLLRDYRRDESLPYELVKRQIAEAEREKQEEERRLAELQARQATLERARAQRAELAEWRQRVAVNLDRATFAQRRLLLAELDVRVIVRGPAAEDWDIFGPWDDGILI